MGKYKKNINNLNLILLTERENICGGGDDKYNIANCLERFGGELGKQYYDMNERYESCKHHWGKFVKKNALTLSLAAILLLMISRSG